MAQEIKGKVSDKEGKPLPYATIKAIALPDSATIVGGVTKEDGTFALSIGDHKLPILLKASLIGYSNEQVLCKDLKEHTLTLSESTTMLEEVAITANRVSHRLVAGGLSTQIDGSPLSKLTDIYSVLRGIPLVEIENDKVKVTGKGTPVIYINDRLMTDPNQMRELKPYLIKDIQVITNPGAKYSSSVGAVIKIYTRREPGSGLSGNLEGRLSKIKGCKLGYGTYFSFNYRKDNWDFFINSWNGNWRGINITDDATFIGKVGQNKWTNTSSIVSKFGGDNHNLTFGVNYSDDTQSAGVQYRLSANNEFLTGEAKLISSLQQNKPLYSFTEESKPWIYAHRPSLYYLRKIGQWKTQIDIDYYESTKSEKATTTKRGYTEAYELKALKGRSGDKYQSAGARLDIDGPLWGGSLNVGGGYSWANNSFFNYSDPELKLPDLNSTLKEQTYVLYAEYSHAIAQKFMLTAGLRMEHVRNRYDNQAIEIKDYIKTNLFPTLSFGGQLWGVNTQLSFRSQINRPNFWRLQPGYQYLSEYEYQVGDPNLKPGLSYTTQLMLNKSWVTLMLTHEYKVNSLTQETQPMKDPSDPNKYLPHKTVLKHINAVPYSTLGGALVLSPRVKWWQPTFTVGGMKLIGYDLQHFEETITNRKPFIYLNWQNQFTLPKELTITANLNYLPAGGSQDNLDIIGAQAFLNTEISKRWLKDNALTTTFELNNLTFTPMKVRLVTKYTELTTTQRVMPQVTFTIAYRFNATKQKYQGKGALGSVIDRM
ncbi:hypothetical protein CE91St14_04280 [Porphyromonas somerae]|nr:hypothetical protein CE91St14_04280 [Porphyromonas somerae]